MKTKYLMLDDRCMFAIQNIVAIQRDNTALYYKVYDGLGKIIAVRDSPQAIFRPNIKEIIAKNFFKVDFDDYTTTSVYINKKNEYAMLSTDSGIVLRNGMGISFGGMTLDQNHQVMEKIIEYLNKVAYNKVIRK